MRPSIYPEMAILTPTAHGPRPTAHAATGQYAHPRTLTSGNTITIKIIIFAVLATIVSVWGGDLLYIDPDGLRMADSNHFYKERHLES